MSGIVDRNAFLADLREGIMEVIFTKVDGSNRILNCTLNRFVVPPPPVLTEEEQAKKDAKKPRKVNPDVCAVWDVDLKEWRSFRYDSVVSVQSRYTT